ncbi:MAG: mechanosensitive ion channel family protein [Anaerolineales bacterium]|nr:mechanosensitive ion channel family protein [Anaerolineales bacterium]
MDWNALFNTSTVATALRIALILLLSLFAGWLLRRAARLIERRLEQRERDAERIARLKTLVSMSRSAVHVVVLIIAALMVLQALAIDIAPLLASLGVASLALSLGAQAVIRDVIGGVLILIEDQYRVGDVIRLGEASGTVERITLRTTHLRDLEGRLHVVPNGDVRTVANLTAGWSRAVVDLSLSYNADMSRVLPALEAAAARVAADEAVKDDLLEAPQVQGWVGLRDWSVQVRLLARTLPGKQWGVMMAMRRYAVEALQAEGIEVGLPAWPPASEPGGRPGP